MATIYDVAALAGVSPKTVSRRINGDGPVRQSTRDSIDAAIRSLEYVPSNAARSMRSTKSRLIGVITGVTSANLQINAPDGLPALQIVQGIQQELDDTDMTVMIADTGDRADRIDAVAQTFQEHRAEGLIYVAGFHQKIQKPAVASDVPLVLANCFADDHMHAILPDDHQGQFELTRRLIRAGHRRIAYAALSHDVIASQLRTAGYRAALEADHIPFDPELVDYIGSESDPSTVEHLMTFLKKVLELDDPATMICFGNDQMAMRAYGMLRSMGLSLPDDVSIAGYDNYRPIAEALFPPLTSVELPYSAMGRQAAQRLLKLIQNPSSVGSEPMVEAAPVRWRESVKSINVANESNSPKGGK
ncbi:MAG: LacI family DNA-binding transcriptional regulator [Pseudomonadota bacterium]